MSKVGFALVGLDHWYAAFSLADAIGRSERAHLVAVAHHDEGRAQQVAREREAALATNDYRAAIERPDVDVVVAMYSVDRNVEVCQAAAAASKQIIGVKPMALDLAGAGAIVAAVGAAGVHYLPFESTYRLAPEWRQIKGWLDEGRIGLPLRYTQTLHSGLPMPWPEQRGQSWWLDPARVPGGGWLDHAIYAVDLVRWLFASEPRDVRGVVANVRYAGLPLEDYGAAIFMLANGVAVQVEDTWTAAPGFWFNRSEIVGSGGAVLDETRMGGELRMHGVGGSGWTVAPPAEPQGGLVEHMIDCMRGEQTPVADAEDGLANLAACLAFYTAARTGATTRVGAAGPTTP